MGRNTSKNLRNRRRSQKRYSKLVKAAKRAQRKGA